MAPSTTPTERTYTVTWHRPDGEQMTCTRLTPRVAFARLWAAWKEAGEITVTDVVPEWLDGLNATSDDWPYLIPPPVCTDAKEDGWTCITHDGTGFWCPSCTLWAEENAAILQ